MSSVALESFSIVRAPSQAFDISEMISSERYWLRRAQPDTVQAFNGFWQAVPAVVRRVLNPELHAYIIRKEAAAIGLATIISRQRVIHPTMGLYEGYALDYFAADGEDRVTHRNIVTGLIKRAENIHYRPLNTYYPVMLKGANKFPEFRAMASVVEYHPNPAIGFAENPYMVSVGEPACLSTDMTEDRYGMPAQLYVVSKNPLTYNIESN
jgi:hypothetical protein